MAMTKARTHRAGREVGGAALFRREVIFGVDCIWERIGG